MPGNPLERLANIEIARKAAQKYGLPEKTFITLLEKESGFQTDALNPKSGAAGIGQELNPQEWGTTSEELRRDPAKAIAVAAGHFKRDLDYFHGDQAKAMAAYVVGAGTVDLAMSLPGGKEDWLKNVSEIARRKGWDDPTGHLQAAGLSGTSSGGRPNPNASAADVAKELGIDPKTGQKISSGSVGVGSGGYKDPSKPPSPADFYIDLGDGTQQLDSKSYQEAMQSHLTYQQAKKLDKEFTQGPISQYMDDIIDQIGKEIAVGNLDLSKASAMLTARTSSYKTALDAFSSDGFKYGAPAGAEYVPGFEPGSYANSTLGLAPKRAEHGITIDPLAEARGVYDQALSSVGGIQTPSVPNIADTRSVLTRQMAPGYTPTAPALLTSAPPIPNSPGAMNTGEFPVAAGQQQSNPRSFFEQALASIRGGR